jgi:hypothetical protein
MIEKCRIELLELYQQLIKKDKELEKYLGEKGGNNNGGSGNYNNDNTVAGDDNNIITALHK